MRRSEVLKTCQNLSYEWVFQGDFSHSKRTVVLLHGLLGNKKNLKSFAGLIVRTFPTDWQVLLMDLPGHGATPALNPRTNFPRSNDTPSAPLFGAAESVAWTCNNIGIPPPEMICGHSMGGKVALAYLQCTLSGSFDGKYFPLHPRCVPRSTWTLDSTPGNVSRRGSGKDSIAAVFEEISAVRMPIASKSALVEALKAQGSTNETAQWMTTNLVPAEGGLRFSFDLEICRKLFESYSSTDFLPLIREVAMEDGAVFRVDLVRAGGNISSWPCTTVKEVESTVALGEGATFHLLDGSGDCLKSASLNVTLLIFFLCFLQVITCMLMTLKGSLE